MTDFPSSYNKLVPQSDCLSYTHCQKSFIWGSLTPALKSPTAIIILLSYWKNINLNSNLISQCIWKCYFHVNCKNKILTTFGQKKWYCFRKSAGWKFFYQSPACMVKYVSEYTFLISKNKKKQTNKKQESKKAKETKEEKRIFPENRLRNKFAAARVKIFLVTCISGNKSIFLA